MRQLSQWRARLDDEGARQQRAPPPRLRTAAAVATTAADDETAAATAATDPMDGPDSFDNSVSVDHHAIDRLCEYTSSLRVAPNQVAGHSSKGVGLPSLVDVVAGHFLKPCPDDRKVGSGPLFPSTTPCHAL
jgi:hypothetical protein